MEYAFLVISILICVTIFIVILYRAVVYKNTIEAYYSPEIPQSGTKYKILVYQCGAYKTDPEFLIVSKRINKAYCDKHGYAYMYINYDISTAPPYWLKAIALKTLLDSEVDADYIMYMDCDAVFYNFDMSIETVLDMVSSIGDYSFIIGKDPNPFTVINTGVFIVKRNVQSIKLTTKWSSMCLGNKDRCGPPAWVYTNGKWICSGKYAGSNYEQGSFEEIYRDNPNSIAVLNMYFLSNPFIMFKSYILHLMAHQDDRRNTILVKYEDSLRESISYKQNI